MAAPHHQGNAPPPTLNVSTTISKHAHSSSLLVSHLVAAAINHLLFARGQIAFPVSTLQKRTQPPQPGVRRDRKRDATLEALGAVGKHVGAALSAEGGDEDGNGLLPLLVLFGPSPLSPLEAFAISIQYPPDTPNNNGESTSPPPTLNKLLSTLEQRLVRFLIATEELQDALADTLRPTKMHLFVLRREGWRAEGWKPRRGFRAQLGKVWGQPKTAMEEDEGEEVEEVSTAARAEPPQAQLAVPQSGDKQSSNMRASEPANFTTAGADLPPFSSTTAAAAAEEDVGALSEALSPLKKRRRPPLVARTSSSYSTSKEANGLHSPRSSSAMLLKSPSSSKMVKARHVSGAGDTGEDVLWSLQPAAQMRRMGLSAAMTLGSGVLGAAAARPGLTLESSDEEHPQPAAVVAPSKDPSRALSTQAPNGQASQRPPTSVVVDSRPPGSRLFPASATSSPRSASSSSLLARSRIALRDKSASSAGGGTAGQPRSSGGRIPRTRLKGPKGAAFVIDCGGGGAASVSAAEAGVKEEQTRSPPRHRLGFESLDEKGCALAGWQWFQCEVSVSAYLGA